MRRERRGAGRELQRQVKSKKVSKKERKKERKSRAWPAQRRRDQVLPSFFFTGFELVLT